jgi:hypothetical protein
MFWQEARCKAEQQTRTDKPACSNYKEIVRRKMGDKPAVCSELPVSLREEYSVKPFECIGERDEQRDEHQTHEQTLSHTCFSEWTELRIQRNEECAEQRSNHTMCNKRAYISHMCRFGWREERQGSRCNKRMRNRWFAVANCANYKEKYEREYNIEECSAREFLYNANT